jgi:hypothetical protein
MLLEEVFPLAEAEWRNLQLWVDEVSSWAYGRRTHRIPAMGQEARSRRLL